MAWRSGLEDSRRCFSGAGVPSLAIRRHTIWELVAHMTFWETEVYRRLNNLPPRPTEELNFPAMPEETEDNWNSTLAEFRRSNADFRQCLSQLDAARLEQTTPGTR